MLSAGRHLGDSARAGGARVASLLLAILCLFALQYLPYHLLTEHHGLDFTPRHSHGDDDSHHSDDHESPASGHTSVGPQPGTRFDPALSLQAGLVPDVSCVLLLPSAGQARVAVNNDCLPPPPDLGPEPARGPPRCTLVG